MQLLFLNDIPVRITKDPEFLALGASYDCFLSSETGKFILPQSAGHMLIKANQKCFEQLLAAINQLSSAKPQSITIWIEDDRSIKRLLEQRFRFIKAAGGVVSKENQILMIHRLSKWDLPKGKVEKGEKRITAAAREVVEECGVQVTPIRKLCSTWHTYTRDKVSMLKETTWYAMACVDDTRMRPQVEEEIDKVSWISDDELNKALERSYTAIRYVLQAYRSICGTA